MKNWLTIGQFAAKVGLPTKALRLYEQKGLVTSHARGDNGNRYYDINQVAAGVRLKEFKTLGFSLAEIRQLLKLDKDLGPDQILLTMKKRLTLIDKQVDQLARQKEQIEKILISLKSKSEPLAAIQRRAIMNAYGKISVVVTGCYGLAKTAEFIQKHLQGSGQSVPIIDCYPEAAVEREKPYILVINEQDLGAPEIKKIYPDVIVVNNIGTQFSGHQHNYLNLFSGIGPHVNTVLNADDRLSVDLARQPLVQKGRIFYYSKNKALLPQIAKIGGVMSDGEDIEIHGYNLGTEVVQIRLDKMLTHADEIALLASLGAVMTSGIDPNSLYGI